MNKQDNLSPSLFSSLLLPAPGVRRVFLTSFALGFAVLGTASYLALNYASSAARERLVESVRAEEQRAVEAMARQVEEALFHVSADLLLVRQQIERYMNAEAGAVTGSLQNRNLNDTDLARVLLDFANSHRIYHQLRYLDLAGNEVLRVNNAPTGATLAAVGALQDKSDTPYVLAAQQLQPGSFLITPMDANRELGQIQLPVKPVVRLLTPVFSTAGDRLGTAIINYEVAYLMRSLESIGNAALGSPLMVSARGRDTLQAFQSGEADAIAIDGPARISFADHFPKAWAYMQEQAGGVVTDEAGGIFSFKRLAPAAVATPERFPNPMSWNFLIEQSDTMPGAWYLISHLDSDALRRLYSLAENRSRTTELIFTLLIAALAWALAMRIAGLRQRTSDLHQLATRDPLTGLLNRREFERKLEDALAHAQRFQRPMAVLYIDLDGFKAINDTLGHAAGDQLLKTVAQTLQRCTRRSDVTARLGGDEFAVVLRETRSAADTQVVVDYLKQQLDKPVHIDGAPVVAGGSIGASTYPDDATTAAGLTELADQAMYRDKERRSADAA